MPKFGTASSKRLASCHPDLITIFSAVIRRIDCIVIEGHRKEKRQNELYRTGKSQVQWPNSKHNTLPSMAVDVAVYHPERPHIHWSDADEFVWFAEKVSATANHLYHMGEIEHLIRSGTDWDQDGVRVDRDPDESFFDGPHFELYKP